MGGEVVADQKRQEVGRQDAQHQRREKGGRKRQKREAPPAQTGAQIGPQGRRRRARQQAGQRIGQQQEPAEQQPEPGPARIERRRLRAPEDRVQPGHRFRQALAAVQHPDVLDAVGEDQTPGVACGEAADGLAFLGRLASAQAQHPQPLLPQPGLPGADDDQQVPRRLRRHHAGEERDRDGRRNLGLPLRGVADDDVRGHRVPQQRQATIRARQRQRMLGHLAHLPQQVARRTRLCRDVAQERGAVAAVAQQVVGHGKVPGPRQRHREGRHELLRPGETVGDQHDGRRLRTRKAIDRHRRRPQPRLRDIQSGRRAGELPEARRDGQEPQHHREGAQQERHGTPFLSGEIKGHGRSGSGVARARGWASRQSLG